MRNQRDRFVRSLFRVGMVREGMVREGMAAMLLALGVVLLATATDVRAQSPADFYKGRDLDLYIGYSPGGAYDLYARMIGRHMGAHLPGQPTLVPKNLEGAGSLRLANYLYRVAPK